MDRFLRLVASPVAHSGLTILVVFVLYHIGRDPRHRAAYRNIALPRDGTMAPLFGEDQLNPRTQDDVHFSKNSIYTAPLGIVLLAFGPGSWRL